MDGTAPPDVEGHLKPVSFVRTGNVVAFSFTVTGTPKPKARPRTVRNRHTGFVQTYTPYTTVNWEQTIVFQVNQALAQVAANEPSDLESMPFTGRVMADVRFYVKRPKSAPKSVIYPMKSQPGDVDNLAKSVLDALQLAGVIGDDKTVTDLATFKRFADESHPEGVEVDLIAWLD